MADNISNKTSVNSSQKSILKELRSLLHEYIDSNKIFSQDQILSNIKNLMQTCNTMHISMEVIMTDIYQYLTDNASNNYKSSKLFDLLKSFKDQTNVEFEPVIDENKSVDTFSIDSDQSTNFNSNPPIKFHNQPLFQSAVSFVFVKSKL